jgi:hypothetical protein
MEYSKAKNFIKNTFEAEFDRNRFRQFIMELLNDVEETPNTTYKGNTIPKAFQPYVRIIDRLGKYEDSEDKLIDVLIVHLKKESSLERARTMQRNLVGWYLNGSRGGVLKDAALVAFVSPDPAEWRFSLVKMDYEFVEQESGGVKVEQTFTPARRYSFLVGSNEYSHTAQRQLISILENDNKNPTFKALEEAFSVEPVTERFYEEYRELFLELKEELDMLVENDAVIRKDFEERHVDTVDFAKKLMGQIVFLYFLQKKGWFGVDRNEDWGSGPKHFLRELFEKQHAGYVNFFNDILEPLFYEALAIKRTDDYYSRFNCKIPFLNGGLFDPIQNYDWIRTDLLLPNELFSNKNDTGILDVFDRYNFTVKENEPLEKEVAVDPEMLGKVFENLLEVEDRKSKGTYYTPREIVHYMCQESLINHLETALGPKIPTEELATFVRFGEQAIENDQYVDQEGLEANSNSRYSYKISEAIRKNAQEMDEELASICICDPAVGSGAFLVGMMNEIVRKREVLTSYLTDGANRSLYQFKKEAIHNSLYGVDIEAGAVEIAKLRLWLSLVVEEDNIKRIASLPNLDYKIMQGNSLLEEYEGIKLIDERFFAEPENNEHVIEQLKQQEKKLQRQYIRLHQNNELTDQKKKEINRQLKKIPRQIKQYQKQEQTNGAVSDLFGSNRAQEKAEQLLELQDRFFDTYRRDEKQDLKTRIETLTWELIELTLQEQNEQQKLEELKTLRQRQEYPFFLWRLHFAEVFQDKGGFDVVIANPPYIKEYTQRSAFNGFRDSPYYQGKMDIWYGFACKSIDLLKQDGIECFIAQNNWVTSSGASIMRNKVLDSTRIRKMIDFGSYQIFDTASIQTMVMVFQKDKMADHYEFDMRKIDKSDAGFDDVLDILDKKDNRGIKYLTPTVNNKLLTGESLTFSSKKIEDVLTKLFNRGNFKFDNKEVGQGIVAPQDFVSSKHLDELKDGFEVGDGIFVLHDAQKRQIDWNEKETKIIKPFFTTNELHRYYGTSNNNYWLIYTDSSFGKKYKGSKKNPPADSSKYPKIISHLNQFRDVITSAWKPYGLHRAREERLFIGEKIISLRKCSNRPRFTYTNFPCYVSQTYFVIKTDRIDLKYLTGLLNSRLIMFWLKHKGKMQGNNFQVDKGPLMKIPIFVPDGDSDILDLINKVNQILQAKEKGLDTQPLEKEIDRLVYQLYGLSEEEVAVVEGSS